MLAPVPLLALIVPLFAAVAPAAAPPPAGTSSSPSVTLPTRGLVIVLRPNDVGELTRTALARVTGELAAARFKVTVVPLDPHLDPTPQVETVAPESKAVAAIAIGHMTDYNGDTIAIWVCDRLGRRTTIQRMTMRGNTISQDAEVLALEAIELIRVSIAGLWPVPRPAPPEPNTPLPTKGWERPEISVGIGIASLQDAGMPSPQWMGALTAMAKWPRGFAVRGQVTGLGPSLTLTRTDGTAAVHRELVSLGLAWFFWSGERVHSYLAMAAGAEHVDAAGAAAVPARGTHASSAWAPIASAGLGGTAQLTPRVSLSASVDGLWAWSKLDVLIGDTQTKPFSRPGALVNVGLRATF